MTKFDDETLAVFSKNIIDLCDSLKIMEKTNDPDGINLCKNYINTFVQTMTDYGHLGEIKGFIQSQYDEKYIETINNSYIYNQSERLLAMSCNIDSPTNEDILNFLTSVEQAGEVDKPLESINACLDQQQEDLCPFEPDFKTESEQTHYYLVSSGYETAKQFVNKAQEILTPTEQVQ